MKNTNNVQKNLSYLKSEFNRFRMRKYLNILAVRNAERDVTLSITPLGKDGTSYTDGQKIVITLWDYFFTKSFPVAKEFCEVSTAHEAEHCRSSNFNDYKRCAEAVGKYYHDKYGYNEKCGFNLGGSLYNIVEDGRIERIACNRFPGMIRGFKLLNSVLWLKNELDIDEERNMYADFMAGILTISKTGVKPKNWDVLYNNTDTDEYLNKIAYIIYTATCSNFTEDVVKAVLEINEIIDPFIHEAIAKNSELMDKLDQMAQDYSKAMNDQATQQSQAGSNGGQGQPGQGVSINTPQGIPGNGQGQGQANGSSNGQGNGVGNTNGAKTAEEAAESAEDIEKTAEDLENEISNDEDLKNQIKNRQDQVEKENEANSDNEITQEELDKIAENSNMNFGQSTIEHFQQALEESEIFEPTEDIRHDGMLIYNALKNLFIKRNNSYYRNLNRGRLDSTRLAPMVAINKAGGINDRIFYKINKAIEVSCAAYVIADTSGSTSGYIFDEEMKACSKIEGGFGKLIPLKIAAYDSDYNFRFRVIRDFNNKSKETNLSYNFLKHQRAGGGTPTGEAMALAGYELSKRKEKNKLLIVITDGEPDNNQKVKEICHKLRKQGIKVIAILVSEGNSSRTINSFNEMYEGKDIITQKPEQIAGYLTNLLSKWITSSTFRN